MKNVLATPQANGVVSSVTVHVGQKVGKGQVLAMLDAAAVEQQIKAADVQMTFAKTVYEKTKRLVGTTNRYRSEFIESQKQIMR